MLLVFCGIDGSGKTEYQNILKNSLIGKGMNTICIDPMQNGNMINNLKKFVEKNNISSIYEYFPKSAISICYALDMLFHMNNYLSEKSETIIISHRYDICCKVYSIINEIDITAINNICKYLPSPDLIIFLDVTPETALQRIIGREKKSWKENKRIIEKAYYIYKELIKDIPENQILILDNNTPQKKEANIDIIIERIDKIISTNHSKEVLNNEKTNYH